MQAALSVRSVAALAGATASAPVAALRGAALRRHWRPGVVLSSQAPQCGAWRGAAGSAAPPSGGQAAAPGRGQGPVLVSPSGAPLASAPTGGGADGAGAEVQLTSQNAAQVLQSPSALLLLAGELDGAAAKKVGRLRVASQGRLPLVRLDCAALPQICEALQIKSSPTLLLMARGQVAAALEGDMSPAAATGFVEQVAQMLGLKVELAEDITELLAEAEEAEWKDAASASEAFARVLAGADLTLDARVRASAGQARCILRQQGGSGREDARAALMGLDQGGHGRSPEVKQGMAMLWLDERRQALGSQDSDLDKLKAAAEAAPDDLGHVEAYAIAAFWASNEAEAFQAGLKLLRKKRSEEARKLVLSLVEALGPRHPKSGSARRSFSNALFV